MSKKVLSLFGGIEVGCLALKKADIEVSEYHSFEMDKHAVQISRKNHPEVVHHGKISETTDFTQFKGFDLLTGGFPCQSYSQSGKRLGLEDLRGQIIYEVFRALKETQVSDFMLENVGGLLTIDKGETFKFILGELNKCGYAVDFRVINSSRLSAQNRVRLYIIGKRLDLCEETFNVSLSKENIKSICNSGFYQRIADGIEITMFKSGLKQPEDKGITWGDVRETGVEAEKYYYTEKAMQWLAKESRRKNKVLTVHTDEEKQQMLEASHYKKYSAQRFFGIVDVPLNNQSVGAMRGRYLVNGKRQDGKQKTEGLTTQYIEFRYDGKTNCLTTVGKDNIVVPFTLPNRVPVEEFFFRYITPLECERLQNLPDLYSKFGIDENGKEVVIADSNRYKAIGNAWGRDIIVHIFNQMFKQ